MNILKSLRYAKNEKQSEIANLLGITRAAYSNIENGKRQLDNNNLLILADHYNVSVDYLLGREKKVTETEDQPAAEDNELDVELVNLMENLSQEDFQRVKDFVAGLKAARGEPSSRHP